VRTTVPLGASLKIAVFDPLCKFLPEYELKIAKVREKILKFCRELQYEGVLAPEIPDAWIAASLDKLMFTAWENIQSGDIAAKDAPDLVLRTFLNGNGPVDYGRFKSTGDDESGMDEGGKGDGQ
jgi:hypothetical protein